MSLSHFICTNNNVSSHLTGLMVLVTMQICKVQMTKPTIGLAKDSRRGLASIFILNEAKVYDRPRYSIRTIATTIKLSGTAYSHSTNNSLHALIACSFPAKYYVLVAPQQSALDGWKWVHCTRGILRNGISTACQ